MADYSSQYANPYTVNGQTFFAQTPKASTPATTSGGGGGGSSRTTAAGSGFNQVKLDNKGTYGAQNIATGQVIAFADPAAFHQYFTSFDANAQMAKFDTSAILNNPNQVLNLNQVKATEPLKLGETMPPPTAPGQPNQADAMVAGSDAYSQNYADVTAPETPEQKQEKKNRADLSGLYEQTKGRAEAEIRAEDALGVSVNRAALADINAQILSRTAAFKAAYQLAEGQAIPMSIVIGQQAQIKNKEAVEIGMLQARALGLQGQINSAIDQAQRAVDLQFAPIEDEIRIQEKQMALAQPVLDAQEKRQLAALQLGLDQKKEALAEYKAEVKTNLATILTNGVKTQFVNENGKFYDKNGKPYSKPEDFFKDAGVKSFQEAYDRGMVTDVASPIPEQDTQVVEINNRKVLINAQTGATIKDLGYSGPSGSSSEGAISLTNIDKQALLAAGFTASEITKIVNDVNTHGIESSIAGLPDSQANAIRKVLGGSNNTKFLTSDFFRQQFGNTLDKNATDAGYTKTEGGLFGSKVLSRAEADTDAYLQNLMKIVEQYRQAGYNDQDILKMMS